MGVVERLSRESGGIAFFKWLFLGILAQVAGLVLTNPLALLAGRLAGPPLEEGIANLLIVFFFFAVRYATCSLPCRAAGARKNIANEWVWVLGGLLIGQLALALVAALPAKPARE
jgi:hypothetical protein